MNRSGGFTFIFASVRNLEHTCCLFPLSSLSPFSVCSASTPKMMTKSIDGFGDVLGWQPTDVFLRMHQQTQRPCSNFLSFPSTGCECTQHLKVQVAGLVPDTGQQLRKILKLWEVMFWGTFSVRLYLRSWPQSSVPPFLKVAFSGTRSTSSEWHVLTLEMVLAAVEALAQVRSDAKRT